MARPDRARIPSDIVDRRGVAAVADLNIPLACGSGSCGDNRETVVAAAYDCECCGRMSDTLDCGAGEGEKGNMR